MTPEELLREIKELRNRGCRSDARKLSGKNLDTIELALKALIREEKTYAIADELLIAAKDACYALGSKEK